MIYSKEEIEQETLKYFNDDHLATNVWVTKYALRDKKGNFLEKTPDDMHKRLAKEFAKIEKKFGGDRALSYDQIYELLKDFNYIVPQGSPMMGIGNNYVDVSLSNCVVVDSPEDNMSSIMESGKQLANLYKKRCGVGVDISKLRPEGASVSNAAGSSTGAWSFADFYSYITRMVGQAGRRGALMITMDIRHPDIDKFITMKQDLRKVTGANVSVKITDDFMNAVEADKEFELKFPIDAKKPKYSKNVKARELWELIINSATSTAEPGLMMWDNILNNLPAECYAEDNFKTLTTNPCGEIPLSAGDSCRLISINLKNFVDKEFTKSARFNFNKFEKIVTSAMRLSDDLVELELEKLEKIIEFCDVEDEQKLWGSLQAACKNGRRTGLGTHGLADAIACLGLRYDSKKAIKIIDKIYGTLRNAAYSESVELAKERGPFLVFNWEKEKNNNFIKRLPEELQELIKTFGRRNISILTNAPTGSVSIVSQTSSGLEPVFRNFYIRRRKLSHDENDIEPDFVDELGDKWSEYKIFHHNVEEYLDKFDTEDIPDFFVESDQIDWPKRVEIQAVIQKSIDHSISSTINLPKETDSSVVGELYLQGWKKGLKGITVYVDGSRSGVLVTETEKKNVFPQNGAPKRPHELSCDIHHTTIQGEKWTILIGLFEGKPYEVLGGLSNLIEIPKRYTNGGLTKHSFKTRNNRYDLQIGEDDDAMMIKDIVKVFDNPTNSAFTRMISLALRHGAKPSFLVEQLQKDRNSDMFSFSRCIARILKNYIQNGERVASDKVCRSCQEEGLVYQDGCETCTKCGYAKCG